MTGPPPELVSPLAAPFRLEGGNGEAVVLVHGFTGIPGHFQPLAEHLNHAGFTVNVPLLHGHGATRRHLAEAGADDWERSVVHAAQAVADHRRVHLVGLSMGGLLCILVARRVAAASIATVNSPVLVRDKRLYLAGLARRWRPLTVWEGEEQDATLDESLVELAVADPGFHTASAAQLAVVIRRAYLTARRIRRPALVVQSRTDRTVSPVSGPLLARALGPPARLVWLDDMAHNALLDRRRHVLHDLVLEHLRT